MKASEFTRRLVDVARNNKTLYVMGCFGAPMNAANKKRYTQNHSYNKNADRTRMIQAATADTFGFDCVCLIKGILWGWSGDLNKTYGGAAYVSNGVPDVSADGMIRLCQGVTTNFSGIVPGAAVWMSGHIGVYIGDGLAVECSPKWANGVQITAVGNIGKKPGYNTRTWTKWGLLPYVDYSKEDSGMTEEQVKQIAQEVAKAVCAQQTQQTYEQWKQFMERYRQELGQLPPPDWAQQTGEWQQATAAGITDGSRPCDLASRAEVAAMIVRSIPV